MIASLRGTVLALSEGRAVVEVGGVGLAVAVTSAQALALRIGLDAVLHTALIVREDELSLYGFASREELEVFDLLRGVSGVGPKSALGVLSAMTPAAIATAVAAEDDAPFRKVSGVGPKTAKLIVVSLAGKLIAPPASTGPAAAAAPAALAESVIAGLVGLGWPERSAAQAVAAVAEEADSAAESSSALLRRALAHLGPAAPAALGTGGRP